MTESVETSFFCQNHKWHWTHPNTHTQTPAYSTCEQAFFGGPDNPLIQTGGYGWRDNAIPTNICTVTSGTTTTGLIPTLTERDTNKKNNLKLRTQSRKLTVSVSQFLTIVQESVKARNACPV